MTKHEHVKLTDGWTLSLQESPPLRDAKGPELVELVVERLETPIASGQLRGGDRFPPERVLASQLGVSRATVREALLELELKGLVERRQGRGTAVVETDRGEIALQLMSKLSGKDRDLLEVMDFREAIEVPMAARAARFATGADITRLERVVERMSSEVSRERSAELDARFHHLVARASHNALLVRVVEWSNEWTAATRGRFMQDTRRRRSSLEGHREILRAVRERDPDGAAEAMQSHLRKVTQQLMRSRHSSDEPRSH